MNERDSSNSGGDDNAINPFAAPTNSRRIDPVGGNPITLPPPEPNKVFVKWLLVCTIAAAPSFFLGGGMGQWRLSAVLGMVFGVLVFVVGYTALELTAAVQNQMNKPVSRRASWIAYLTRAGISIVFPVGVVVDMFCGIFAVGISAVLTGFSDRVGPSYDVEVSEIMRCFQFFVTTVAQGVLLNFLLFAYMGVVWVICNALSNDQR